MAAPRNVLALSTVFQVNPMVNFKGGSFRRNAAPQRQIAERQTEGQSLDDVLNSYDRQEWAQQQAQALDRSLSQEQITPYWLTPIGDSGFYITPDEPADPTDCDRYPGSPWCGESGVDAVDLATFSPLSTNLIFTANQDGTEYCLRIDFSLFAIALPPGHICYRTPDAAPFNQAPPPAGIPDAEWHTFDLPPGFPGGLECDYLVERLVPLGKPADTPYLENELSRYYGGLIGYYDNYVTGVPIGWYLSPPREQLSQEDAALLGLPRFYREAIIVSQTTAQFSGNPGYLLYSLAWGFSRNQPLSGDVLPTGNITLVQCPTGPITPPPIFTTPPHRSIPPHPFEPMSCCNTLDIEEMLRVIMLRLGTAQYPATVPKNVADSGNETMQIDNLTDFLAWTFKQNDALIGQFPLEIEIKDADPAKEGNQSRTVKLPNMGEAISELYALALRGAVGSDIHTSFLMRLAAEVIATKNASLITQDYAKANASYLGYKGNTVKRNVNYSFNVNKLENLEKILAESQMNIIGWQDDDKNTVQAYLEKLMFAAGIIKQVFFRSNDQAKGLIDELGNLMGIENPADSSKGQEKPTSEDEWRAFLQEINSATGGFNRNSPIKPEVLDPTVSGEKSVDTRFTGFDLIPAPDETT